MIDEVTLNRIIDSVVLLVSLTYFLLWYERNTLKPWQINVGNITSVVYSITMITYLISRILA